MCYLRVGAGADEVLSYVHVVLVYARLKSHLVDSHPTEIDKTWFFLREYIVGLLLGENSEKLGVVFEVLDLFHYHLVNFLVVVVQSKVDVQ